MVDGTAGGPLSGTKVVDLTRFVAGSYTTMTLAALGAEVIMIEVPPGGDSYRSQGAVKVGDGSTLFDSINRGKRSVLLDFREPDGAKALETLLAGSDFFVHNARPGAMDRYGLDFASLHDRHGWIIYASISAFGDVGPDAGRGGFDLIVQAESGLMGLTGSAASGPVKVGTPVLDIGAGLAAVVGILSTHQLRMETGVGSEVVSSLLEFALAAQTTLVGEVLVTGAAPPLLGSHSAMFSPYGAFRARDGHFVLAGAGDERLWGALCSVLDRLDLVDDVRFVDNAHRVKHRDELTLEIESALASDDVSSWLARLDAVGIPAGTVRTLDVVLDSPQVEALDMVRTPVGNTDAGPPSVDMPFRFGAQRPTLTAAPRLGADTRAVFDEMGVAAELAERLCSQVPVYR